MQQALVYFKMPSELRGEERATKGKFVRVGGMVVQGSLEKDLQTLTYRFQFTDANSASRSISAGCRPICSLRAKALWSKAAWESMAYFTPLRSWPSMRKSISPPADGQPPQHELYSRSGAGAK